jgi:hypothetical protein
MKTGSNVERPRKRTCRDRWRYRRQRMRRIDPAASVALKLLLIILDPGRPRSDRSGLVPLEGNHCGAYARRLEPRAGGTGAR